MDHKVEELLREARQADKADKDLADQLRVMVATEGWRAYMQLLERRLQLLSDQLLSPAESMDRLVGLEYVKGAMSGLVLARDLPSVTIAAMAQLRQEKFSNSTDGDDDADLDD